MRIHMYSALALVATFNLVGHSAQAQTYVGSLYASDGQALDGFGGALAWDQARLLVGSPRADLGSAFPDAGKVYLFEKQNGSWSEQFRFEPNAPTAEGRFGSALGILGNTIILGAPRAVMNSARTGAVHFFRRAISNWLAGPVMVGTGVTADGRFGAALVLDGQQVIVGAPQDSFIQGEGGRAFIFEEGNQGWAESAILEPPATMSQDPQWFGAALAIEGNRLAVGAPERSLIGVGKGAGCVFVYERTGGAWVLVHSLEAPLPEPGQHFGEALALNNGLLAVGASAAFSAGQRVGRVTVFDLNQQANPVAAEFEPEPGVVKSGFGSALAWQGSLLAVGGPNFHGLHDLEGRVWLYGESGAGWIHLGWLESPNPVAGQRLGSAVVGSPEDLLVGADAWAASLSGTGEVRVHSLASEPTFESYCLGVACPCGNIDPRAGCTNSTGLGGRLSASGSLSLAAGNLCLSADRLAPGRIAAIFWGSPTSQTIAGDGLRCVGLGPGGAGSFLLSQPVPASGVIALVPGQLAQLTGAVAGDNVSLQVWFRDPFGPCSALFNSSNALTLGFLP